MSLLLLFQGQQGGTISIGWLRSQQDPVRGIRSAPRTAVVSPVSTEAGPPPEEVYLDKWEQPQRAPLHRSRYEGFASVVQVDVPGASTTDARIAWFQQYQDPIVRRSYGDSPVVSWVPEESKPVRLDWYQQYHGPIPHRTSEGAAESSWTPEESKPVRLDWYQQYHGPIPRRTSEGAAESSWTPEELKIVYLDWFQESQRPVPHRFLEGESETAFIPDEPKTVRLEWVQQQEPVPHRRAEGTSDLNWTPEELQILYLDWFQEQHGPTPHKRWFSLPENNLVPGKPDMDQADWFQEQQSPVKHRFSAGFSNAYWTPEDQLQVLYLDWLQEQQRPTKKRVSDAAANVFWTPEDQLQVLYLDWLQEQQKPAQRRLARGAAETYRPLDELKITYPDWFQEQQRPVVHRRWFSFPSSGWTPEKPDTNRADWFQPQQSPVQRKRKHFGPVGSFREDLFETPPAEESFLDRWLSQPAFPSRGKKYFGWNDTVLPGFVHEEVDQFFWMQPQQIPVPHLGFGGRADLFAVPLDACLEVIRHLHGREPIGIAQLLGHEYPLVEPSDDIKYLLADASLVYDDPSDYNEGTEFVAPFRIRWIYGLGCEPAAKPTFAPNPQHEADVLIVDRNNQVVFDSTTATSFHASDWGPRLRIFKWQTAKVVFLLVQHTAWSNNESTPKSYPKHLVPESAILDERAVVRAPKRVRRLIVNSQNLTGNLIFEYGYNLEIKHSKLNQPSGLLAQLSRAAASTAGKRTGHRISMHVDPGSGVGFFPSCSDVQVPLKTINTQKPNKYGDMIFSPEACYWAERPGQIVSQSPRIVAVEKSTLLFHNDCEPCCSCDEFVEVKLAIDKVFSGWKAVAAKLESVRDKFSASIDRWEKAKKCFEDNPQRLEIETACDGFVSIAYGFASPYEDCRGPLDLVLKFATHSATGLGGSVPSNLDVKFLQDGTTKNEAGSPKMRPYTLGGSYPDMTAHWSKLDASVPARLDIQLQVCGVVDGDSITVTATPTFAGKTYPTISNTAALKTPCSDEDQCV